MMRGTRGTRTRELHKRRPGDGHMRGREGWSERQGHMFISA